MILGQTLIIGKITVEAEAEGAASVEKVEFWVDDTLKHTVEMPPYKWVCTDFGMGQYELKAVAYYTNGVILEETMSVWKIF